MALILSGAAVSFSELWGERGEEWSPGGRLPDFSHAGYHRGEVALPAPAKPDRSVRDYGAKGDGVADDSAAFLQAIAAGGVIDVPPGRYKITTILKISQSGVVLRGAGPAKSTLFFPQPLNDIEPNWGATTEGRRTSNYSWSGGFVSLQGDFRGDALTKVTAPAERGSRRLQLASTTGLRIGQEVEIYQEDNERNTLAAHLYSGDPGSTTKLLGRTRASLVVTIEAIDANVIVFDRPLRFDVRGEWKPTVRRFEPTVTEAGIEGLAFEFPERPYEGHFTELGFNPIALGKVAHCWVRNVRFANLDSGIFISGKFNTVTDVVMESSRARDKGRRSQGHHGIYLSGDDNLFTRFDIRMKFVHDLSVSHCAGNVISAGSGEDLTFDHHKRAPYENLYTDIDAGEGTEVWRCGGGRDLGKHCGARGTFWNIRAARPIPPPPDQFGPPSMNFVAIFTGAEGETSAGGRWFETIDPARIEPRNLHLAQVERRLTKVR